MAADQEHRALAAAAGAAAAELIAMRDDIDAMIARLDRIGELRFVEPGSIRDFVDDLNELRLSIRRRRDREWSLRRLSNTLIGYERRAEEAATVGGVTRK